MVAIRYLSQVFHALQFEMYTKSVSDESGALQASMDCAEFIEKIAKLDSDNGELRARMILVADAMRFLVMKRHELDSVFINSQLRIPSTDDLQNLMGAASVKFS